MQNDAITRRVRVAEEPLKAEGAAARGIITVSNCSVDRNSKAYIRRVERRGERL